MLCRPFVLYNSLTHARDAVVRLHTDTAQVVVQDAAGNFLDVQVDPYFKTSHTMAEDTFKVGFSQSHTVM